MTYEKKKREDIAVQGLVAIVAGIIFFGVLFLPWFPNEEAAIFGIIRGGDQTSLATPMVLMILGTMTIFGGAVHIAGYKVGIQITTVMSAIAFFISVMAIVATLIRANYLEGRTINLLIGPWICAAGSIFGVISSKLERK